MAWVKKGLIYAPSGQNGWDDNSVMTPTPFLITPDVIRIYGGFRDKEGISRIGYIDVNAENPSEIYDISKEPILDIGQPGMFDDNGVILGDIVPYDNKLYMYYIGFQIPQKVKFVVFTGLAISEDNGNTFKRYSNTPIMDRTHDAPQIRAAHSAMKCDDHWKIWYAQGDGWEIINNIPYPRYYIRYVQSANGIHFDHEKSITCITLENDEYRIGRPRVNKRNDGIYEMRFTLDTLKKEYKSGYATSKDGMHWTRDDTKLGLTPSSEGWDSEMACYPVLLNTKKHRYMFYSGNGMGRTGVGYAQWEE